MFLKPYNHLLGYLERWTIFKKKRLHIRLHRIKREDATPFLHTHPFSYISIILRGGYTESQIDQCKTYSRFSIICRSFKTFHRLKHVQPNTLTLFITWSTPENKWSLKLGNELVDSWINYPPGVYLRKLNNGSLQYSKFDKYWFKSNSDEHLALLETEPSINQTSPPLFK